MKSIKQLLKFISPYKKSFILSILMIVITCLSLSIAPSIEGNITSILMKDASNIINGVKGAKVEFSNIYQTLLILLIVYITKTISQSITTITLTNSIQATMKDIRYTLQDKIRHLPVSYFDKHQYGDVLSYITNDVDTLSNAMQQTLIELIRGVLMLLFGIIMMFTINITMTLIVLLIIPSALIITKIIVNKSQKRFNNQQSALGELNGAITEIYSGNHEIMLFNKQEDAIKKFKEINERLCNNAFLAQFMSSMISPLITLITYTIIASIGLIGSLYVLKGIILVGQLQAFIRYIWQVNEPISQVSNLSSQIQSALGAMNRITDLLNQTEEVELDNKIINTPKGNVVLKDVCFGYGNKEVLHNININIKSGQMVAIVGPTGSGKTTLINLLMNFYTPTSGSIEIDGVDISKMNRTYLRSLIGMVLQDTWLFNGTIYDNIHYGRRDARKDEVIEACKLAGIDHFIRSQQGGYNMIINEDTNNISQGEKQLLTIARAILKNPEILILDEATSSVDTRLEKLLQDALHYIMKDRTSIVIAHRLSTIRNADMILVIKDGKLVEQGKHQELLDKKGFYSQLYNAQFNE